MGLTFQEAIDWAKNRGIKLPDNFSGELQDTIQQRAFTIAGIAMRDQLQMVLDSLVHMLNEGGTYQGWVAQVTSGTIPLEMPEYRLDNIFRTNMQVHYNAGHWQQQQQYKDRRPYLMYDAVNDSRTRPTHLAMDNIIRPVDDPFWDHNYPPNGYRCRCSAISLTQAQSDKRGGVTDEPAKGWPQPDKGWFYNPGKDPEYGINQAAQPPAGGSHLLQSAMTDRNTQS
jgi:SPP1 gp7 family putative phage head morphogenesis protein